MGRGKVLSKHRIVLEVTVKDTPERTAKALTDLAGHLKDVTGQTFMKGGEDLMGYDGAMIRTIETRIEES